MIKRAAPPVGVILCAGGAAALAIATASAGARPVTAITVRADTGGYGYGGSEYGGGAYITQRRELDVDGDGRVRFAGVANSLDPGTVEFRSVTGGDAVRVVEQRQSGNRFDPTTLLQTQLGQPVVVTTSAGAVSGTLRAIADGALVLEGADHTLQIVPRGAQVASIKLTGAGGDYRPALEWRLTGAKPGRHEVEVSYQVDRMSWRPSYAAIVGDDGSVELSSWAVIDNRTGADFEDATVTLTSGGGSVFAALGMAPIRPVAGKLASWVVPSPVTLRDGDSVQVELAPKKRVARPRTTIVYEALDPSAGRANTTPSGCGDYTPDNERIGRFLELEVGARLPDGRIRVLRRTSQGLQVVGDEQLRASADVGVVRIPTSAGDELTVTGSRTLVDCQPGADGRSLREELTLDVHNDGKVATEVVIREYMFRWHTWKIVSETVKGTRVDDRTQEYRLQVPPGGDRSVRLVVRYEW